jgi:hypothetical protein
MNFMDNFNESFGKIVIGILLFTLGYSIFTVFKYLLQVIFNSVAIGLFIF